METKSLRTRYPAIEPYKTSFLQVNAEHSLYYEESGNPQGKPVLFLHGGPGSGCSTWHREYFDPKTYRIILMDQRGSGQSTPHACLNNNTTWDLVSDIELLREKLKVDRWLVFGGSWGSTLALAYAEKHPERTKGLVLRGIFLCRKSELEWFYQSGAHNIYADEWESYRDFIPEKERGNMMAAYYKRLTSENSELRLAAAKAWSRWEGATLSLIQDKKSLDEFMTDHHSVSLARIECHYFVNKAFFSTDNYLIENVGTLRQHKVPGVIVQGRYDIVCPFVSAWELHKAWPEAKLEIIQDAGHAASEPGIVDALIRATDQFREL